jgi:acetyl-CoA C-acetyltransferase
MARHAAVAGVGFTAATSPRRQTNSVLELCHEAVDAALGHAGAARDSVDAIVMGNIDGFEGTVLAGRFQTQQLGLGRGIPVTIVNTGGTTGGNLMQVAARKVRSGSDARVLCIGGPTFFGARDLQAAINTNSPMVVEQPLGMGGFHMGAFAASAYQTRWSVTERDFAEIVVADHRKAALNPYAHLRNVLDHDDVLSAPMLSTPLRQSMICPVSTSACAMLVTTEESARDLGTTAARIVAIGASGDPYLGGGKGDFGALENLAILANRVYRTAGIVDPRNEIDVVELFAPYAHMQPMQLEALRLCEPGQGIDLIRSGQTYRDGDMPVNLSGGPKCTNAGVAGELSPFAWSALQVMGGAPAEMQVDGARVSLAHGTGGTFFQFENLAIFERIDTSREQSR